MERVCLVLGAVEVRKTPWDSVGPFEVRTSVLRKGAGAGKRIIAEPKDGSHYSKTKPDMD